MLTIPPAAGRAQRRAAALQRLAGRSSAGRRCRRAGAPRRCGSGRAVVPQALGRFGEGDVAGAWCRAGRGRRCGPLDRPQARPRVVVAEDELVALAVERVAVGAVGADPDPVAEAVPVDDPADLGAGARGASLRRRRPAPRAARAAREMGRRRSECIGRGVHHINSARRAGVAAALGARAPTAARAPGRGRRTRPRPCRAHRTARLRPLRSRLTGRVHRGASLEVSLREQREEVRVGHADGETHRSQAPRRRRVERGHRVAGGQEPLRRDRRRPRRARATRQPRSARSRPPTTPSRPPTSPSTSAPRCSTAPPRWSRERQRRPRPDDRRRGGQAAEDGDGRGDTLRRHLTFSAVEARKLTGGTVPMEASPAASASSA